MQPRRYPRKDEANHGQDCESTNCRFALVTPDGTHLGCAWRGNRKNKYNHDCAVVTNAHFKVLRDCYDFLMRQIEEKDKTIAEHRSNIDVLNQVGWEL